MEHLVRLSDLLIQTNKLFQDIFSEVFSQYEVSNVEVFILYHILESPKTIGDLSKVSALPYSTISGVVDRLERDGYVVRKKDQHDRRVVWVYPARDRAELESRLPFLRKTYIGEMFKGMPVEEVNQICESLVLINAYLRENRATHAEQERK
ncbi:MAG: winged helix DNA-binding protein [Brevibacillus sp.]|nr:winged helix DNA-binding protein [Brevibacillus sp.]